MRTGGVQQMRQRMRRRQRRVQRMQMATNARKRGCAICASGTRRVGDSSTNWRRQGVLCGAHNLLEREAEQHGTDQTSVLKE